MKKSVFWVLPILWLLNAGIAESARRMVIAEGFTDVH